MPRMIGIGLHHHHHHQMSYSPAARNAAGSNADRKTNKSPAVRALRVRELADQEDEPRVKSVERSASTSATGGAGGSRSRRRQGQLVEAGRAETEMPAIVLDSLDQFDRCHRTQRSRGATPSSKTAATHQAAERVHHVQVARSKASSSSSSSNNNNNNNLLTTVAADADQQARHFRRQARRQLEAQRAAATASNQVVLIMSDSAANTSGVPILGRLLPSKSCGLQQRQRQQSHHLQVCESEPVLVGHVEPVFVAHHHQQVPVLGRRSHRLHHQPAGARRQAAPSEQWLEQASQVRASRRSTETSSSSCSSLAVRPQRASAGDVCLDVCCHRGGSRASPELGGRLMNPALLGEQPPLSPDICLMPCCQFVESSRVPGGVHAAPNQSHTSCQANGFELPDLGASRRSSSLCRLQEANFGHHHLEHRRTQRQPPRVPTKPISYQANRSPARSLNESNQLLFQYHANSNSGSLHFQQKQQQQQQQQLQQQQEHESEAVTQMYESLAAELKAKLGNPNRAPILLPPKDYDTLCRQQGRLKGIETRRSTNPQLVGPKTKLNISGSGVRQQQQQTIAELEVADVEQQNAPAASYDPTNRLERGGSLQRSRSNSSSGLGSISISAGSPDQAGRSSPSQRSSGSEPDVSSILKAEQDRESGQGSPSSSFQAKLVNDEFLMFGSPVAKPIGAKAASAGRLPARNGRVEVPLKVNNDRRNGNTYLATKQIIY